MINISLINRQRPTQLSIKRTSKSIAWKRQAVNRLVQKNKNLFQKSIMEHFQSKACMDQCLRMRHVWLIFLKPSLFNQIKAIALLPIARKANNCRNKSKMLRGLKERKKGWTNREMLIWNYVSRVDLSMISLRTNNA